VLNDARAANHPAVDGLKAGLRDLGFAEGRDVIFDVKLFDGDPARMPVAASALAKAGVDVIFTSNETATLAARGATQTIPIVFTLVGDPVAAGIVKSSRADGNLRVSSLTTELVRSVWKRSSALAPGVQRVWAIHHGADPASGAAITRALENSSRFGIEILPGPSSRGTSSSRFSSACARATPCWCRTPPRWASRPCCSRPPSLAASRRCSPRSCG
jgi:putative ABC transport system substrate-binding protein